MPSLTPRATVVHRLAEREAELLDQAAASVHVLIAVIWEGGGVAATALAGARLGKGTEIGLRRQIADTSPGERGATVRQTLRAAGEIARELGHDYIGTEHQLFAIINDSTLSEALLPAGIREQASTHVHDLISGGPTDTRATGS